MNEITVIKSILLLEVLITFLAALLQVNMLVTSILGLMVTFTLCGIGIYTVVVDVLEDYTHRKKSKT